jgi:hypothetical protein
MRLLKVTSKNSKNCLLSWHFANKLRHSREGALLSRIKTAQRAESVATIDLMR